MTPRPTPDAALAELLAGNHRFVAGAPVHPHQDAEHRAGLAAGQRPFAVLFGCSDSRLAAEIIFDRGLGDLFVVRTAGHIVGPEVLASIEYAVLVLETPLVVVLGHDSCGAVQATCAAVAGERPAPAELTPVVDRVAPSVAEANARGLSDPDDIARLHVGRTVDLLTRECAGVARAVAAGRCAVVGMSYRLAEGQVTVVAGGRGAVPAAAP
ncbi:MAG TPA: carbonic anhydrase [Pilimelia sp.]|nr:carbonic anhydrase [Pilimelia sp.]